MSLFFIDMEGRGAGGGALHGFFIVSQSPPRPITSYKQTEICYLTSDNNNNK